MERKITNIKERVLYIAEYKGINKEIFFEKIGASYAAFKGVNKNSSLNSAVLESILTIFSDISPDWLICGKGKITRGTRQNKDKKGTKKIDKLLNQSLIEQISKLTEIIDKQQNTINTLTEINKKITISAEIGG